MTTEKSFRINLTVPEKDMDRLKDLYYELIGVPGRFSFTAFCHALLMDKVGDIENGAMPELKNIVRPGRPKVSE